MTSKKLNKEFNSYIEFLESFSNLLKFSGRQLTFISDNKFHILDNKLIDSSVQTLKSIELCSSIGSFSDANTLIRKLRDDLMLYSFILVIINKRESFTEESLNNISLESADKFAYSMTNLVINKNLSHDEKALSAWLNNTVDKLPYKIRKKLSFENYMDILKSNEHIKSILATYQLNDYWEDLRIKLNDYVHNNGIKYTSHNLSRISDSNYEIHLKSINERISFIISFYLVTIIMIDSTLMSSGEMIDYLDLGIEPPEDCQYEIAPFIQSFIDEKIGKLHPDLKQFLRDQNSHGMHIN